MYVGDDYRSQVGGCVRLSLRKGAKRVRILLIRQRYSDCPIAKVEFQVLFPGCRAISHMIFLANRNVDDQYAKLRTKEDTDKASIIQELRESLKCVKERIAFLLCNGNNIEMEEIGRIIKEVCLK